MNKIVEAPLICSNCGFTNMVDLGRLSTQQEGVLIDKGFYCTNCEGWEHSHYENPSLNEKLVKLERLSPASSKFQRGFSKLLAKYNNLQMRWQEQKQEPG